MGKKLIRGSSYSGIPTLEVLEGAYRYNGWIADTIMPFIYPPVLEVGSGIGNISAFFIHKSSVVLTDNDKGFINYLKIKFKNEAEVANFDISKPPPKSMMNRFNTVVSVNVLEHLENDQEALINMKKALKKRGKLVILVPAKKSAFNKLDRELGHFRRYEKDELISKLNEVGFKIESMKFFNALGLATWVVRNYLTGQNIQLTSRQVTTFDLIVPILKIIEKIVPLPIGISLIAVAKNEDKA